MPDPHLPADPTLEHLEVLERYTRSPHLQPVASDSTSSLVDELLRLACLTYGEDRPARQEQARQLLAEHPHLATATIHTMAATGEVAAAAALLGRDPAQARLEGGPHRWEPLLYLAYSRLDSSAPGRCTLEVARLLLQHGADPNAGYLWDGRYPFTALTGAFGRGEGNQPPHQHRLELARLLLEAGADPNDSQTLYNCGLGSPSLGGAGDDDSHIELLFQYGLGRDKGGPWHARLRGLPTPAQLLQDELLRSARHDRPWLARLLIERGVDTNGRGSEHPAYGGHTAYELAMLHGNPEIVELLAAAHATTTALDPVHTFVSACMRGDRSAIDRLLAADPGLAATAVAREPYLIGRAAEAGRPGAIRLMAELGFDVNLGDALVHREACPSVMGFLGERDPSVKVERRATALHLAAWRGDLEVVKTLIELGADGNLLDSEHHSTPRGWAEYNHQHEVAAYLESRPQPATRRDR